MCFEIKDNEKLQLIRNMFRNHCFSDKISDKDIMFDRLKELGLIDLWYNPIFEETITFIESKNYKVGDIVFIKECETGSRGAKDMIGVVSGGRIWNSGCSYIHDHTIFVQIGNNVWNLGKKENVVLLVRK